MKFVALGATGEIGASCHYLHIDGTGLVLDAGTHPEHDGAESIPDFDRVHGEPDWYVDHALITHAHHDHLGGLPVLIQHFPHVVPHMTPVTRDLAEFLLPASARLQRRKLEEGSSSADPLFDEEEIDFYSHLFLTHELGEPFEVTGLLGESPVEATFFDAGHILGSAGTLIEFEENGQRRRLFYTSDTNTEAQTIIPGAAYPEPPIDVLVLESTAGNDPEAEKTTRHEEEEKLADALAEVLGRDGTALIPVFAMGRSQEVLALIDRFKKSGRIPKKVPVYTAGSMRAIADMYDKTRQTTPRVNERFKVFGVDQERLPRSRKATDRALEGPSIHVVSSGMMFERTISNRLAQQLVGDEKNGVLFVGYAKEDSPAARLKAAAQNGQQVTLDPDRGMQDVNCTVGRFRLSGHSHRHQLVDLVGRMQPTTVLLVHGEEEARAWMEGAINGRYPEVEVIRPKTGEALEV